MNLSPTELLWDVKLSSSSTPQDNTQDLSWRSRGCASSSSRPWKSTTSMAIVHDNLITAQKRIAWICSMQHA